MLRLRNQEEKGDHTKEGNDGSRDEEGQTPATFLPTLRPERRDDGAQDVAHRSVGVPDAHD